MTLSTVLSPVPKFLRRHKLVQLLIALVPDWRYEVMEFNNGARALVDLADSNARNYFLEKSFDPVFFEIARPFLSRGGVILDIGANFGLCSFGLLHALNGTDLVMHLFEANPHLCDCLKKSAALYPGARITINHCCVSDRPGVSSLHIEKENLGSSYIASGGDVEVPNLLLDEYLQEKMSPVAFVKMDIEGFEVAALRGARSAIERGALPVIYLEVSEPNLHRQNLRVDDCFALLRDAGYALYYCKEPEYFSGCFLEVHGARLPVGEVVSWSFQPGYQTDLLAVHKTCAHVQLIKPA